jgi:cyclin-dependent kinase regulatory subunit CKS1
MPHYPDKIEYSPKYQDKVYEYRHVLLPKEIYEKIPHKRLLNECEWRVLGLQMSKGWIHYTIHKPEPHVLLFRRPIGTDPENGFIALDIEKKVVDYENSKMAYWNN